MIYIPTSIKIIDCTYGIQLQSQVAEESPEQKARRLGITGIRDEYAQHKIETPEMEELLGLAIRLEDTSASGPQPVRPSPVAPTQRYRWYWQWHLPNLSLGAVGFWTWLIWLCGWLFYLIPMYPNVNKVPVLLRVAWLVPLGALPLLVLLFFCLRWLWRHPPVRRESR